MAREIQSTLQKFWPLLQKLLNMRWIGWNESVLIVFVEDYYWLRGMRWWFMGFSVADVDEKGEGRRMGEEKIGKE